VARSWNPRNEVPLIQTILSLLYTGEAKWVVRYGAKTGHEGIVLWSLICGEEGACVIKDTTRRSSGEGKRPSKSVRRKF
jgi:hypothetical protein